MDIFNAEKIDSFLSGMAANTLKAQVATSLWMNADIAMSQILFLDFLVRSDDPKKIANELAFVWGRNLLVKSKNDVEIYRKLTEDPGKQGEMARSILPKVEAAAQEAEIVIRDIVDHIKKMGEEAALLKESQG